LKNHLGTHLIGPQWTYWRKKLLDISPTKFGSEYAQSTQKYSNFEILAKIEGEEANKFSKIYQGHIRIWFRSKNKSKLFHACEPLTRQTLSFFYRIVYIFLVHLLSSPALFFIGSKLFCFFVFKRKYSVPCWILGTHQNKQPRSRNKYILLF
jgi:hypothetical protein